MTKSHEQDGDAKRGDADADHEPVPIWSGRSRSSDRQAACHEGDPKRDRISLGRARRATVSEHGAILAAVPQYPPLPPLSTAAKYPAGFVNRIIAFLLDTP